MNNLLHTRTLLGAALMLMSFSISHAQQRHVWEDYYEDMVDLSDDETADKEEVYDILCEMEEHPIDINAATREVLGRIPFLSDIQIEDICAYIYTNGPMRSVSELMMIESLGYYQRRLLECFIYIGDEPSKRFPSLKNIIKYGEHDFLGMGKLPLYDRKGDRKGYYGYKYKHYLKYAFSCSQYVRAGVVASQDAGEPFFANVNDKGYDYYSYYLLIRNLGRVKALAVGKYRIAFGMGLVANLDYSLGKTIMLSSLGRTSTAVLAHSSLSDYNYLRGAAATVALSRSIDVTAFFSHRDIDATMDDEHGTITTILRNGYHRTESELRRKHNASQMATGADMTLRLGQVRLGLSGVYTSFSRDLVPNKSQDYRRYYPEGNGFYNIGVHYGYTTPRLSIKGETAVCDTRAMATVNTVSCRLGNDVTAMALQRFYSYKYYALLGNSFKSGSSVQNESGIYAGINWNLSHCLSFEAYADYAHYPWKRYLVSASSRSVEGMLQMSYHGGQLTAAARYQLRMREKDNEKKTALIDDGVQRMRLWAAYDWDKVSVKAQGNVAFARYKNESQGWMTAVETEYEPFAWLRLNASGCYFSTDDYASRIYAYEKGLLYSMGTQMYYGKGFRFVLMARCSVGKKVMVIAKGAMTKYNDRDHISSGLQQIDGSSMTDLYLQVRVKL